MTYDEFLEWAVQTLLDGLITGGFSELKKRFKYSVMNVLYQNRATIWKE
jgi:hypothetical protein